MTVPGQPASKTEAGDYAAMSAFDCNYSLGSGEDEAPVAAPVASAATVFGHHVSNDIRNPATGDTENPATSITPMRQPEPVRCWI